jgi:lipid-A-disaccharide synthase
MSGRSFMLVAGEASGDALAAELVAELRRALADEPFAPRFFGAGGPQLAAAGVDLAVDLTRHAVTGLADVLRKLAGFRRLLTGLVDLACARQPDVIVLVDFQGFNRRLARALRRRLAPPNGWFHNWRPRVVQYVSPQVWASRPGRAYALARDVDLLLCLFPFEREWYARRVPRLRVVAVGHPVLDRHPPFDPEKPPAGETGGVPEILLLPGSRPGELKRHLPPMLGAARLIAARQPARFSLVLPDDALLALARAQIAAGGVEVAAQVGGLGDALGRATVALASTGTVTLECAVRGVPTVALYITAPLTYRVGRRLVTVKHLAMPNLLAGAEVMPEFIQDAATPENLARAALEFLTDPARRAAVRRQYVGVVAKLGSPGASRRAAAAIVDLLRQA